MRAEYWWIFAGFLVILEMMLSTFYLLMVAMGAVAAAIAVYLGLDVPMQVLILAVISLVACLVLFYWRAKRAPLPADQNPDVNLDIGNTVRVEQWDNDGRASIFYRGVNWSGQLLNAQLSIDGRYKIVRVVGSCLMVEKEK